MHNLSNSSKWQASVTAFVSAAAVLASFLLGCPVARAGFDEGQAAFDAKDYALAMHEWSAGAEQGDARAQYHLAILYERGLGTEKNIPEAFKWARLAAQNGEPNAQFALSMLYAHGGEVDKDEAEAAKWFKRGVDSAHSGNSTAQYLLSGMYETGQGVEKDDTVAITWLRSAADLGNAAAQAKLGERYAQGRLVERNQTEAEVWLGKAATQREAKATSLLLPMLRQDFASAKDDLSAVEALRKAAELDDPTSQYLLGMSYWFGRGVARDPVQACTWIILSGAKPEEVALRTGGTERQPTAAEIQTAAQAAAAWRRAHPNLPRREFIDVVPTVQNRR
jgi:TPR repeat protein